MIEKFIISISILISMKDEIDIWLSISDSLLTTTLDAYKVDNSDYYHHVRIEVNKIIGRINDSKYSTAFELPKLSDMTHSHLTKSSLMEVISVLRQIKAFLGAASGRKANELNKLNSLIEQLQEENTSLKKKEEQYLDIIKNSRNRSDYGVDQEKLGKFHGTNLKLINEALDSYSVGAYTACICVCRNILQDLVQKLCQANSISEGSLGAQIEKLVENKTIKSSHHSLLIELSKFFGHRAAHPTTEVFNKEKASLVLSALFIINEEVFSMKS